MCKPRYIVTNIAIYSKDKINNLQTHTPVAGMDQQIFHGEMAHTLECFYGYLSIYLILCLSIIYRKCIN